MTDARAFRLGFTAGALATLAWMGRLALRVYGTTK